MTCNHDSLKLNCFILLIFYCQFYIVSYKKQQAEMFFEKTCSQKLRKIQMKNTCGSCNFIQKETRHKCFPVKFAKFLNTFFFTEHFWTTASVSLSSLNFFIIVCRVVSTVYRGVSTSP